MRSSGYINVRIDETEDHTLWAHLALMPPEERASFVKDALRGAIRPQEADVRMPSVRITAEEQAVFTDAGSVWQSKRAVEEELPAWAVRTVAEAEELTAVPEEAAASVSATPGQVAGVLPTVSAEAPYESAAETWDTAAWEDKASIQDNGWDTPLYDSAAQPKTIPVDEDAWDIPEVTSEEVTLKILPHIVTQEEGLPAFLRNVVEEENDEELLDFFRRRRINEDK